MDTRRNTTRRNPKDEAEEKIALGIQSLFALYMHQGLSKEEAEKKVKERLEVIVKYVL